MARGPPAVINISTRWYPCDRLVFGLVHSQSQSFKFDSQRAGPRYHSMSSGKLQLWPWWTSLAIMRIWALGHPMCEVHRPAMPLLSLPLSWMNLISRGGSCTWQATRIATLWPTFSTKVASLQSLFRPTRQKDPFRLQRIYPQPFRPRRKVFSLIYFLYSSWCSLFHLIRSLPVVDCLFCSICGSFRFSNTKESFRAPDITITSLSYFRPPSKDRCDRAHHFLIFAWWTVPWGGCHCSETNSWRYCRLDHSLRQNALRRSLAGWLRQFQDD